MFGISIEDAKSIATAKYKGMTYTNKDKTSSTIYIDDNHNNGALDTANTMGHEVTHARVRQGETRDRGSDALNEEYANTMGKYSADGMQYSSYTYNGVQLDNSLPTYRSPRSDADKLLLNANTDQLINDVQRVSLGDGFVNPLNLSDYEALEEAARNGDWGAAQILAEEKESITIQKDIGGATTDTIKVIDDYTLGIGQTVSDIQEIAGGNYKIILASGAEFIVSRVGGRFVTKVGGKIVTWTKKQWDKVKGSYKVDGKDSAKNIANYDRLKDQLAGTMGKPQVADSKLQSFLNTLYRDNAKIGSGSTADAVRYEIRTGKPVGGKFHTQKAQDSIIYLQKWLKNNTNASFADKQAIKHIIRDTQNALNGK